MSLAKQLKSQKVACHRSNVSFLASRLWAEEPEEPEDVKNTYRKMVIDAQMMHNQGNPMIISPMYVDGNLPATFSFDYFNNLNNLDNTYNEMYKGVYERNLEQWVQILELIYYAFPWQNSFNLD
ncbi:hypothetical protein RclHR1_05000002 [Rhizophagus clarus]|nr:hypothetical protein RclHR1_05000002 [Rhizophagus clarus]